MDDSVEQLIEQAREAGPGAQAGLLMAAAVSKLQARVKELEARLEIDHIWQMGPDDGELVRVEIPPEERANQIDGIECRDETIKLFRENRERLKARITELEAERSGIIETCANYFRATRIAVHTSAAVRGEIPCAQVEMLSDIDKIEFIRALSTAEGEKT